MSKTMNVGELLYYLQDRIADKTFGIKDTVVISVNGDLYSLLEKNIDFVDDHIIGLFVTNSEKIDVRYEEIQ